MSRSALWRQEGAKKKREEHAENLFAMAVEEGRNNRSRSLPLWGPDDSFHFNPVLLEKTIKSHFFQKCCQDLTDWNKVVDEIYYKVKDLEPWGIESQVRIGNKIPRYSYMIQVHSWRLVTVVLDCLRNRGQPSTAFCLLLRLLTIRCSEKQMKLLLDHVDSPYIRGIGFLYLRYAGDPKTIWEWIEPYLYDDEPLAVAATSRKNASGSNHGGKLKKDETVGDFVRRLFSSNRDYYGTMLPRLPIQVERDLQVKLLFAEKVEERSKKHLSNPKTMNYFKSLGSRVMALYGDDENPITWYEGVVDRVIHRDELTSRELKIPKFVVTFPEYGNTETVTLGEMEMIGEPLDSVNSSKDSAGRDDGRGRYERNRGGYDRDHDRESHRDYDRRGYSDRGYRDGGSNDNRRGYNNRGDHRGRNNGNRGYPDRDDRWKRDNDDRRGYGRNEKYSQRSGPALPSNDDLYEEVRRRERANVTAQGNQSVARRPPSAKASLTGSAPYKSNRHESTHNPYPPSNRGYSGNTVRRPHQSVAKEETNSAPAPKRRSPEEIAAQQEKKRKLMAKYG